MAATTKKSGKNLRPIKGMVERALIVQWLRKRAASLEARTKRTRLKLADASSSERVSAGMDLLHAGLLRNISDGIENEEHIP